MSYAKRGVRALGLALLVAFGLMAFAAPGAQAGWLVLSANTNLAANENISVAIHKEWNLLVPNQNLEILCNTIKADGLQLVSGGAEAKGAVEFTGCKTFQKGSLSSVCKPTEPILAGGKAHMKLHSGKNYVLFEPTTGLSGVFTIVKFSGLCALPKEIK